MRLSLRFLLSILLFLSSACTTTAAYQKQLHSWQGKNIQTLLQQWGHPDTHIRLRNGHSIYQYTRKTFYTIPEPKRTPLGMSNKGIFSSYDEPWLTGQTLVRYCRTLFETSPDGRITHISFRGNNCVANRFTH